MHPKRIYLASNVFIALINCEVGFHQRGLFVEAQNFLDKARATCAVVVLSGLFFDEIKSKFFYSKEDVLNFLNDFGILIECVSFKSKIDLRKFSVLGIHYPDSLHIAFALEAKCDCIVTFNLKDFLPACKYIQIISPDLFE